LALNALEQALTAHGTLAPTHSYIPPFEPVVEEELWRRFYMSVTSSDGQPEHTRRKAYREARDALMSKGYVKMYDNLVWVVH
jgi:hypothetical protein